MYEYSRATELFRAGDYTPSFNIFAQLAVDGDAYAQRTLAQMYFYGQGTAPDRKKSFFWYKQSFRSGVLESNYAGGLVLEAGGLLDEAIAFYRTADDFQYPPSMNRLGVLLMKRDGWSEEAMEYLLTAKEQGHLFAGINVARYDRSTGAFLGELLRSLRIVHERVVVIGRLLRLAFSGDPLDRENDPRLWP